MGKTCNWLTGTHNTIIVRIGFGLGQIESCIKVFQANRGFSQEFHVRTQEIKSLMVILVCSLVVKSTNSILMCLFKDWQYHELVIKMDKKENEKNMAKGTHGGTISAKSCEANLSHSNLAIFK